MGYIAGDGTTYSLISISRSFGFEEAFLRATEGIGGVDVVLNSLAGEFTDASLRLLPEWPHRAGKTDIRDGQTVAERHQRSAVSGVRFGRSGPAALRRALSEVVVVSGRSVGADLVRHDARCAPAACFCQSGRHIGKVVLTIPDGPGGQSRLAGAPWWSLGGTGMAG